MTDDDDWITESDSDDTFSEESTVLKLLLNHDLCFSHIAVCFQGWNEVNLTFVKGSKCQSLFHIRKSSHATDLLEGEAELEVATPMQ